MFSTQPDDDRMTYVGGVADAVAYLPIGIIELVIDWKTDLSPSAQQIELYREQMRDYLAATGAPEGLLVFVTTGQLVRVRPGFQPTVDVAEPKGYRASTSFDVSQALFVFFHQRLIPSGWRITLACPASLLFVLKLYILYTENIYSHADARNPIHTDRGRGFDWVVDQSREQCH